MSMLEIVAVAWFGSLYYSLYCVIWRRVEEKIKMKLGIAGILGGVCIGLALKSSETYEYIANCTRGNANVESFTYATTLIFLFMNICSLLYMIHLLLKNEYKNQLTK